MYPNYTLMQKQSNCFWAYANGRLRIRERSFGLTRTVARRLLAPCTKAQRTFSAYFALPVCLLRNSHLLTLNQPFTPYVLQTTSSLGRCDVTFRLFRSHLRPVPKSPSGGKVTWERSQGDSPSAHRNVRDDPKVSYLSQVKGGFRSLYLQKYQNIRNFATN